jgi:hypothetical protein
MDDNTPTNDGELVSQEQGACHVSDIDGCTWPEDPKLANQIASFTPAK